MRRWDGFRVWAIVWAVLQLALSPVATFADARMERESEAYGAAHIEASSSATCRPVHAAECALCQFVSHASTPSGGASGSIVAPLMALPPAAARIASATNALAQLPLARGPPIA